MGLGRATPGRRQGGHNEADEVVAGAAVAAQAAAPANRVEAALFDRGDSEASVSMTGIVQLTSLPAGTSEEQILAFFGQLAGDQTPRPPASHRPVYLLGPPEGASARALFEAFVVFDSCEAADRACMLSQNRKLNGRLPEIFRATQEHMQHVLGEAEARAKAAREAAREASRLATIEAARAARAAEKERHRQDALALAASKEAAAKEAREKRARRVDPVDMSAEELAYERERGCLPPLDNVFIVNGRVVVDEGRGGSLPQWKSASGSTRHNGVPSPNTARRARLCEKPHETDPTAHMARRAYLGARSLITRDTPSRASCAAVRAVRSLAHSPNSVAT
jgi:hypothetical protein